MKNILFSIVVAALLATASSSQARSWTSASGATLDAEMVGRDGSFVLLERANGARIKIDISKLSNADQEFVRAQQENQEPQAPANETGGTAKPKEPEGKAFGTVVFQPAAPIDVSSLPNLQLRTPAQATYYGVQYGPAGDDVVIFAFDKKGEDDLDEIHDIAFVYAPKLTIYKTPQRLIGKKSKIEDSRVYRFSDIAISTQFGSLKVDYTFEFIYGVTRPDVLALLVEVKLTDGPTVSKFTLGGFINESMTFNTGEIQMRRILAEPKLIANVSTHGKLALVTATEMGSFNLLPGTGMSSKVKAEIVDDAGKNVAKLTVELPEESLLATGHGNRTALEDLDPGEELELRAALDLGPTLGKLEAKRSFKTKDE